MRRKIMAVPWRFRGGCGVVSSRGRVNQPRDPIVDECARRLKIIGRAGPPGLSIGSPARTGHGAGSDLMHYT
jgi:hypothetical protein